ncbi:NAD(P)/FAD-dependent oxidoreductase [Streptomyces albidus (ex Kaewkla and Franco 2022)]|uniref:NAD(P)/FAD-dependent oxidoreductase n=1 Tax=Streptomyces albidus (ex Kaewkla and Franco 2022) TaxID=722709 RepID=UPI0015EE73B0|nr:NAD(P)/FAD-dependent oxidoreductase [Streptomyces albidus (ex Kaewkla and Franco 2022)]
MHAEKSHKGEGQGRPEYDVIVLGAGIAGTMLGAILARNGAKVLLVDAGEHPKFAVGESTIPETLVTLRIMADRYGVPEIASLASLAEATGDINHSFGTKEHFGFLLHREGEEPNWHEATQLSTPSGLSQTSHLFRQDTDQFLFNAAVRHGCVPRLGHPVSEVDIEDDLVRIHGVDGTKTTGRFLVDASGFRSPLAAKLQLREEPSRLKHHSRSLFTHMVNVKGDEVLHHEDSQRPPTPWYNGTMHHVFERGWFWVIPFDNTSKSRNPLVSVGLTMDPRRYPKNRELTPEQEFFEFASKYPAVARQFEGARAVREWVSTERLQYSSTRSVGARWCLMAHAAGFIDPLFSRGISNTATVVNSFAWRLLDALREDDFTRERFEYVERLEQGLLDHNDALVDSSFIAFEHYRLWSAIFRIWAFGSVVSANRLQSALLRYRRTGDVQHLRELEDVPNLGLWWPDHDGYKSLFDAMVTQAELCEQGVITGEAAADELFSQLKKADFVPSALGFDNAEERWLRPTPRVMFSLFRWLLTKAPADVRKLYLGPTVEAVKTLASGRRPF